ncbi:MAG: hypothetical protein K6B67_10215 [Lachnospiraceae bacterium]|nr:hypothetical protein [Lachnospiraceae bacterium]
MKTKKNNNNKVVKFHKQIQLNIGIIILGIFMFYVLFHLFSYLTRENLNIYEVTAGTLSKNNTYQALAIRSETVVNAEADGHILYYSANLDQVGVKSNVYSIDSDGSITSKMETSSQDLSNISNNDMAKLQNQISGYVFEYNNNNFNKVYNFKNDIESSLQNYYKNIIDESMSATIQAAVAAGTFKYYTAPQPGIVVYQLDGLEGTTIDNFSSDSLDKANLNIQNLKANEIISTGQPVYKLITSDKWELVVPIDDETKKILENEDSNYVEIKFLEDDACTWTSFEFLEKAGVNYLILHLDDSVNRYADSRFLNISLLLNEKAGYKIPNSSIIEKNFYKIPETYLFNGGDKNAPAFMVKNGTSDSLIYPDIYHEEDGYLFVDPNEIKKGTILVKQNSNDNYTVGTDSAKLKGVYCVNKGYATFKKIDILYQNADYAIIKVGTNYGLSLYDHIVLNGDQITENDIIN